MGLANPRVVQTPEFLQPNVRRQSQLTPNIKLDYGLAPLRHAILNAVVNSATKTTMTTSKCLRVTAKITSHLLREFLVELTGIEPVASWLQTRRSPS